MSASDVIFGSVGVALCGGAVFFPWHVYNNPDSYGPPEMHFSRDGIIPPDEVAAARDGARFDFDSGKFVMAESTGPRVDRLTTGRIDPNRMIVGDPDQPFPDGEKPFRVLAIDRARALVGDEDGIYLVGLNSRLPDGSRIRSIARDEQGWHILTSSEALLRAE